MLNWTLWRNVCKMTGQNRWTTERIQGEMDVKSSITRTLENRTAHYGSMATSFHVETTAEGRWSEKILE